MGSKLFFVLQSLEQLKAVYKDNWETFLANSGLKVFFNLEDNFSRDYVSKLIGETEVDPRGAVGERQHIRIRKRFAQHVALAIETRGRSSSTGTSENEGTNSSVSVRARPGRQQLVKADQAGKTNNDGRSWTPASLYLGGGLTSKANVHEEQQPRAFPLNKTGSKGWNRSARTGCRTARPGRSTDGTSRD